ncbi:MAG: hypothetical protein HRU32_10590 [Rhodobacteraceae bacterium]|nr:hypothetical protein [Paracoccaceae bacterium]
MTSPDPSPFELTFPKAEAAFLQDAYAGANSIVEYGSGGSTVHAANLGKSVLAVESDKRWAARMDKTLAPFPDASVRWIDIGRTEAWGYPAAASKFADYWRYPMSPWTDRPATPPDLVLIDGRFRKACLISTLAMTRQPVRILFDDWRPRRSYHEIADLITPSAHVGRLAVFDATPGLVSIADLPRFLPWFFDTR